MLIRIYDAYHSAKFIQISKKQIVQKLTILVKRIFQKKNYIKRESTDKYDISQFRSSERTVHEPYELDLSRIPLFDLRTAHFRRPYFLSLLDRPVLGSWIPAFEDLLSPKLEYFRTGLVFIKFCPTSDQFRTPTNNLTRNKP